jgi:hypothetical protein
MRIGLFIGILSSCLYAEVATPTFSLLANGRVQLETKTVGAVLRYTFEDKDPDKSAGVYLAPVVVPFGRVLRAKAFSTDGAEQSSVLIVGPQKLPSTLVEVTQNRDWKSYDWVKRHEAIVSLGRLGKPDLLFVGDSITHFWGGEPADARLRGAERTELCPHTAALCAEIRHVLDPGGTAEEDRDRVAGVDEDSTGAT